MSSSSPVPDWFPELPWFAVRDDIVYYDLLDALTAALLPGCLAEQRLLASAGRLLGNAIQHLDVLVDDPATRMDLVSGSLATVASCFEAERMYAMLFAPGARFWGRLRGLLVEHARALLDEHSFASKTLPWAQLDEARAIALAVGKNAVARTIAAAAGELAGLGDEVDDLDRSIRDLTIAVQAMDDARDWRCDASARIPSLVVTRAFACWPDDEALQRLDAEPGIMVPHVVAVLDLGQQAFRRGRCHPRLDVSSRWRELMDGIAAQFDAVLAPTAPRTEETTADA